MHYEYIPKETTSWPHVRITCRWWRCDKRDLNGMIPARSLLISAKSTVVFLLQQILTLRYSRQTDISFRINEFNTASSWLFPSPRRPELLAHPAAMTYGMLKTGDSCRMKYTRST